MQRKFNRNFLRRKAGNRNLKEAWKSFQMRKYGTSYLDICHSREVK